MGKHIIEISDKNETSLQIIINRQVGGQNHWASLDKGVWAYDSGAISIVDKTDYNISKIEPQLPTDFIGRVKTDYSIFKKENGNSITLHQHLILCNTPQVSSTGVVLWDFLGWTGVNDSGTGVMKDEWSYKVGGSSNGLKYGQMETN